MTVYETMTYENIIPFTNDELEREKDKHPEDGYPSIEYRLHVPRIMLAEMMRDDAIYVPDDGPWFIDNHPNRLRGIAKGHNVERFITNEEPASHEEAQHWRDQGLWTDTANRALHPRFLQLLSAPHVGMFTGPGFHYHNGPKRMANLGVRRERNGKVEYAAVRKHGKDIWRLPGGYMEDHQETIDDAAFDEGWQEAGIAREKFGCYVARRVFSMPKGFRRDTLHSWGEEHFVFPLSLDNPELESMELMINDTDEIAEAAWIDVETIASHPAFGGTHRKRTLENEELIRQKLWIP
jgi:8-oxo-dGTP pyrophosphatase MutT (NUDIX family)